MKNAPIILVGLVGLFVNHACASSQDVNVKKIIHDNHTIKSEVFENKKEDKTQIDATENKKQKAWITAYWSYPKQDKWTSKNQSSTGIFLKEGEHIAVDPKIIPYGSEIQLPDGTIRKAVDTGSAVVKRKASKGKYIIVDVYFYSKSEALKWLKKYSGVQEVTLL